MNTFEHLYIRFKTKYIYNYGQAKFNTVEEKIYSSSKLTELNKISVNRSIAPNAADFNATIQSIGYFIISNSDTSAMAQMIAIKRWDEQVNSKFGFCTEHQLYFKGESTLKKWSKFYTL